MILANAALENLFCLANAPEGRPMGQTKRQLVSNWAAYLGYEYLGYEEVSAVPQPLKSVNPFLVELFGVFTH